MSVTVYRSTDTSAPTLNGNAGSLITVLDAVLVNGYGANATGVLTSDNTNVANNETVTIGATVYTFKTVLTGAAYEVLIGATADDSLTNLRSAINGSAGAGSTYGTGTVAHTRVTCGAVAAHAVTITAINKGTADNTLATTETSAHLSWGAGTMSGGTGQPAAGWSKPFSATNGGTYKGGSGVQHFYHVDDNSPDATAAGKEAQLRGSETATAFQTGTGFFPTAAQFALGAGLAIRKSAATGATARTWIIVADDRTVYVFVLTADIANVYMVLQFGEIYSIMSGTDNYRSLIMGRILTNNAGVSTVEFFADLKVTLATISGHYMPRAYTGVGGSVNVGKFGDAARSSGVLVMGGTGGLPVPNGADGALHLAPIHIYDGTALRGRLRGVFQVCHSQASFADGDTITGAGAYAGHTFLVIKSVVNGAAGSGGIACVDITGAWETN